MRRALAIGLNAVDTLRYGSRLRPLHSPVRDAQTLARAAAGFSFSAAALLEHEATVANVTYAIRGAADMLCPGDTFVLTFSGHGQVSRSCEGFQQSWCLFDCPLVRYGGDGLDALLARFQAGVRILTVANCCHAGPDLDPVATPHIRAEVMRIAACRADEIVEASGDSDSLSPFVQRFLDELHGNAGRGWAGLIERLRSDTATPQLEINDSVTDDFLRSRPFC